MRVRARGACVLLSFCALVVPARAGELFGGVFAHDVNDHLLSTCCYEHGADIEFGLRSGMLPIPWVRRFADIRAFALGSVNTDGGVDFGSAGLVWRIELDRRGRFYLQPGLGAAVQDGSTLKYQADPDHLYLGSRVLFEPEASLGWRFAPRWAAELAYVHLSHGQLAGAQNPGMDDLGLRIVHRFGR